MQGSRAFARSKSNARTMVAAAGNKVVPKAGAIAGNARAKAAAPLHHVVPMTPTAPHRAMGTEHGLMRGVRIRAMTTRVALRSRPAITAAKTRAQRRSATSTGRMMQRGNPAPNVVPRPGPMIAAFRAARAGQPGRAHLSGLRRNNRDAKQRRAVIAGSTASRAATDLV
jgi:hypothetical protein